MLADSKKDAVDVKELRNREKESVLRRCVNPGNENDTTYCRVSGWESLCLAGSTCEIANDLRVAENDLENECKVDNLFLNEAARRAFLVLRRFSVSSSFDDFSADPSILHLARADASITTMLKLITIDGKGGSRNDGFVDSFGDLLPKALAAIIKDIWLDLQTSASHDLQLYIGNSKEDVPDPYGNNLRDWTVIQKNPHDNHIYLLGSPRYFRARVCSWYGNVRDAHIGRYDVEKKEVVMITSSLNRYELEESDIEG